MFRADVCQVIALLQVIVEPIINIHEVSTEEQMGTLNVSDSPVLSNILKPTRDLNEYFVEGRGGLISIILSRKTWRIPRRSASIVNKTGRGLTRMSRVRSTVGFQVAVFSPSVQRNFIISSAVIGNSVFSPRNNKRYISWKWKKSHSFTRFPLLRTRDGGKEDGFWPIIFIKIEIEEKPERAMTIDLNKTHTHPLFVMACLSLWSLGQVIVEVLQRHPNCSFVKKKRLWKHKKH